MWRLRACTTACAMRIDALTLEGFRNYDWLAAEFHPQVNLIYGDNAQGKTNLLEAVSYLGSGRSFRAQKNSEMIRFGAEFGEIYGEVHSSVLGGSVTVGKGSVVRDSIIMQGVTIGENCVIEKAIIAEDTVIGNDVSIGSEVPNKMKPNIYSGGLATIGENSVIPGGVQIGKNTAISGVTSSEDYIDGVLASGETLIKAGDRA